MEIIIALIGISLLIGGGFLGAFIWAVRSGQFDDTYTPSVRMLFENRKANKKNKISEASKSNPVNQKNKKL
ncbi:MAG: cbb3-type cytochrome oxidase assembly protein CcoS [Cyclobacteriaceae bacterium]